MRDWTGARNGLLILVLEKINLFSLTSLITLVLLMWIWMGLFLRKNHLLRCWGWLFLPYWVGAPSLSLLLKLHPQKLKLWFVVWTEESISINLPYGHALNTVFQSGLEFIVATWNCWISYKNRYVGLMALHLLSLLNLCSLLKCSQCKSFL